MQTQTIQISGLTCSACVKLIQKRLQSIADVVGADVQLSGAATIAADREISAKEIGEALANTPYSLVQA